jgi:hypothetical protein
MVLSNPNPTPKSNRKSFLEYLKDLSWMNKKSWAFQVDTFGNSNIYGLSGINNQCHENHTTITLLASKLLVSSTATPGFTSWGFHSQEEEGDCCCNNKKMGSFGINNQCHENHTTTTLLALKFLVSSARMCQKVLGFEPPTLMGFFGDLAQLWFICLKNIYTDRERERSSSSSLVKRKWN